MKFTQGNSLSDQVDEALDLIDEISEFVDRLPEEAEEFGSSVLDKATDISFWIIDHKRVTRPQIEALENMRDALQKWIRD